MAFAVVGSKHAGAVQKPVEPGPAAQAELVQTYCGTCHGDKTRSGGLSLERSDLVDVPKGADTWEKVIRKVRAGMMPPPGAPRPDAAKLDAFAGYLESSLGRQAAAKSMVTALIETGADVNSPDPDEADEGPGGSDEPDQPVPPSSDPTDRQVT